MAMTMTQKIFAAHCGKESVAAGELIMAKIDRVLANDITAPVAIDEFLRLGKDAVFDREKITLVMDHFAPNKDIKSATLCKKNREFAKKFGLPHFYDGGKMGIEHVILPEKGLVSGGDLVIGADSHTCTYGGLGAFATGVGSTDLGVAMATGEIWLKVPSAIKVSLRGKLRPFVDGKDLILHLIGMIGVDGALYQSLEFVGDGVANLSVSDRLCICNMAIEAGGKNGVFPVDDATKKFLLDAGASAPRIFSADENAAYEREITIDLSTLEPTVAFPHLPANTRVFKDIPDIKIDQVVIGSCTNGRLQDLQNAAEILRGKKVADGVRVIVIPGSPKIYLQAVETGLVKIFIEAGALVSAPTCGPCLGGHMGILAKGERAVSTTNRNFVGRMGDPESEVYLASPQTAAASAIAGKIASPR